MLDGSSLSLVLDSTSSTSATLSWAPSLPSLSATSYSLSYSNSHCFTDSHIITGLPSSVTETTLSDLHPGTQYSVSLTAALSNGENLQQSLVFTTPETGEYVANNVMLLLRICVTMGCNLQPKSLILTLILYTP